jgi:hypothetical protein
MRIEWKPLGTLCGGSADENDHTLCIASSGYDNRTCRVALESLRKDHLRKIEKHQSVIRELSQILLTNGPEVAEANGVAEIRYAHPHGISNGGCNCFGHKQILRATNVLAGDTTPALGKPIEYSVLRNQPTFMELIKGAF